MSKVLKFPMTPSVHARARIHLQQLAIAHRELVDNAAKLAAQGLVLKGLVDGLKQGIVALDRIKDDVAESAARSTEIVAEAAEIERLILAGDVAAMEEYSAHLAARLKA